MAPPSACTPQNFGWQADLVVGQVFQQAQPGQGTTDPGQRLPHSAKPPPGHITGCRGTLQQLPGLGVGAAPITSNRTAPLLRRHNSRPTSIMVSQPRDIVTEPRYLTNTPGHLRQNQTPPPKPHPRNHPGEKQMNYRRQQPTKQHSNPNHYDRSPTPPLTQTTATHPAPPHPNPHPHRSPPTPHNSPHRPNPNTHIIRPLHPHPPRVSGMQPGGAWEKPALLFGVCQLGVQAIPRDHEIGSTTTKDRGCHVCGSSTSGHHVFSSPTPLAGPPFSGRASSPPASWWRH